jgi:hypothetical protein
MLKEKMKQDEIKQQNDEQITYCLLLGQVRFPTVKKSVENARINEFCVRCVSAFFRLH